MHACRKDTVNTCSGLLISRVRNQLVATLQGKEVNLPSSCLGSHYIEELVGHPGKTFSASELEEVRGRGRKHQPITSAQEVGDDETVNAIRTKIRDCEERLEEARSNNDEGMTEQLAAELAGLEERAGDYLAWRGSPKRLSSDSSKASGRCRKAIVRTFSKLEKEKDPEAQEIVTHLRTSISFTQGCFCYSPK